MVLQLAGIEYEVRSYYDPINTDWGAPVAGATDPCAFTGILGDIINNTIATLAGEYVIIPFRMKCMAFTNPTVYTENVIIYKATADLSQNFYALVRVFTKNLWLIWFATICLTTVFLALNNMVFAREEEELEKNYIQHCTTSFWQIIQMICDQVSTMPTTFSQTTHTGRYIIALMGLFAAFYLRLYEGGLLTSLLMSAEVSPFKNIDELADLVAKGDATFSIERSTWVETLLFDKNNSVMAKMRAGIEANPSGYVSAPTKDEGIRMTREARAALVAQGDATFSIERSTWVETLLFDKNNSVMAKMRAGIEANPSGYVSAPTKDEGIRMTREARAGKFAFHANYATVREMLAVDCELKFFFVPELPTIRMSWAFAKSETRLINELNQYINMAQTHTDYINRRYYGENRAKDCVPQEQVLTIGNLYGLLLLSVLLFGISLVAFMFERGFFGVKARNAIDILDKKPSIKKLPLEDLESITSTDVVPFKMAWNPDFYRHTCPNCEHVALIPKDKAA